MRPFRMTRRMGDRQVKDELGSFLGSIDKERQRVEEEYAAKWTDAKRREAVKSGDALPGGKFPIRDQEDMNSAATLAGNSSVPRATVIAHMRKQAKKHGLTLPKSLQSNSSS